MAVTLLNAYIALDEINPTYSGNEGIKSGKVKIVAAGVSGISQNETVVYLASSGKTIRYGGKEYVIVKQADIIGKVS